MKNNILSFTHSKELFHNYILNKVDTGLFKNNNFSNNYKFVFHDEESANAYNILFNEKGKILLTANFGPVLIGLEHFKNINKSFLDLTYFKTPIFLDESNKIDESSIYLHTIEQINLLSKGYIQPYLLDDFLFRFCGDVIKMFDYAIWISTYPMFLASLTGASTILFLIRRVNSKCFAIYLREVSGIDLLIYQFEQFVVNYPNEWFNQCYFNSNVIRNNELNKHISRSMKNMERYLFSASILEDVDPEIADTFSTLLSLYKIASKMIIKGYDSVIEEKIKHEIKMILH